MNEQARTKKKANCRKTQTERHQLTRSVHTAQHSLTHALYAVCFPIRKISRSNFLLDFLVRIALLQ